MMDSPHSLRHHRLSPSFSDSAIDLDLTDRDRDRDSSTGISKSGSGSHAVPPHADRLAHLANLAADRALRPSGPVSKQDDDSALLHRYIDSIESLLIDPRPQLSRVIAQNRPQSPSPRPRPCSSSSRTVSIQVTASLGARTSNNTGVSVSTETLTVKADPASRYQSLAVSLSQQLEVLLGELSQANAQLQLRHVESRHIHDLFTLKCEGLAQRILQLEDEVNEL
jgi:hypothetical protein